MLVRGDTEVASWPLAADDRPGLAVVDELARLELVARRVGCSIRVIDPWLELAELLELAGLGLRVEVGREAEGGEQAGVDEVVVADDPFA